MRRASAVLFVFFLFLGAAAVLFEQAGFTAAIGVEASTHSSTFMEQAQNSLNNLDANAGLGQSLFGMFQAAASTIAGVFTSVYAGPQLLMNVGGPASVVGFLATPLTFIVGIDVLYWLTGRGG